MKIFIILFGILIYSELYSQQPPCYENYHGLTYNFNKLSMIPPLSTGNSIDYLYGYIALDSIAKSVSIDQVKLFLDNQYYNDTIKKIMKYYFHIIDENPIGFQIYMDTWKYNNGIKIPYKLDLKELQREVLLKIKNVSPSPDLDHLLLGSQIIAHVKVKNQTQRNDPSATRAKSIVIDECEILELLKGFPQHNCKDISLQDSMYFLLVPENNILSINDTCLQYDYRTEWRRGKDYLDDAIGTILDEYGNDISPTMKDEEGNPWTSENEEYIVFLNYMIVCGEENNLYYKLSPGVAKSWTGTIYPIVNGLVVYPSDEFRSIGNNLQINTFKNIIKNRIIQIKSF